MTYGAKIKAFRDSRKLTHQQFADAVGVSRGSVQQWESVATAPKRVNQPTVAKFMGISVSDLMADEQPPSATKINSHLNQVIAGISIARDAINLINNPDFPAIRRVNIKLSAGASGFGIDYVEDDEAPIVFQRKWFERNGYIPAKLLAVRVANGSMEPGLYDGDTVVINTADETPKDGEVYAVNYEGELVIKRMVRDAGQWWLASDNPDLRRYPRKVCGEGVYCLGRVVHKQSERI